MKVNLKYVWRMKKVFLILSLITLMIIGCNKDKSNYLPVYNIPQYWKDYAYFKTGTYWIYRDSISGDRDCVYVTENHNYLDTLEYDDELGVYEYMGFTSVSSLDGFSINTYLNTTWGNPSKNEYICYHERYKPGKYVGQTILMFSPFVLGAQRQPWSSFGIVSLNSIYSSYTISNESYSEVKTFNDSENIAYNKNETNFYVSKNIGIIRKELIDSNRVWNLIDKNIMQ